MLRAVLKTQVPSGFCFGSRAAPRATAPAYPIPLSAAKSRAIASQALMVIQPFHTGGRNRARTPEAPGAQGRVEDPSPIRVLLGLQGGSQGHSSCISNTVVCSKKQSP